MSNRGSYSRSGYGNNYNAGYSRNNGYKGNFQGPMMAPQKKHSGCSFRNGWTNKQTGEVFEHRLMFGWNYSRTRGMIKFIATCKKGDKAKTSNSNFENWTVKVTYADGRKPEFFLGWYNLKTGRLHIQDLQMIANPNKNYFGKIFRSKGN
jgi:hypothetical protein